MKKLVCTVLLTCVLSGMINSHVWAADLYDPPSLGEGMPSSLGIPADFKPDGKLPGASLGLRRTSAVQLVERQGIYPIYITEISNGILGGDPLQVGDIIIGVNGVPLGKGPDAQFRAAYGASMKSTGLMWLTRWRKGNIEQVMIDLGSKPLDLTRTGKPGSTRDWALGPIGVNAWGFSKSAANGASHLARQLIVTRVDPKGPAAAALQSGDVILGVDGKKFTEDARKAMAKAINEAEKEEHAGKLNLMVWRDGKEMPVTIVLQVLGTYSETAPFDCAKTDKIIDNAVEHMKRNKGELLKPDVWISFINGLGLLATGRDDVMPLVRDLAHSSILEDGVTLSIQEHAGMKCWDWSYRTLFLCEYYLRTGDKAVLPTIDEYATKIAMGQSGAGTWGHTYAAIENAGVMHGPLGGYGAINQQGLTLMIVLPLAVKCGIDHPEVKDAIKRGDDFFRYFIGKGTIPYGDHGAANEWYDDNGKSGSAAIYFDLVGNQEGARFFSDMLLGSAPSGREAGHTGHFWSHLWGGLGAARGGDKSLQVFMDVMDPIFTLERQYDGCMVFQENVGEAGDIGKPKDKWDSTGSRLLQLCVPRRVLYISGKETPRETHLTDARIRQLLIAGRLDVDEHVRTKLTVDQILALLQDPLPPTRAMAAKALVEQELNIVDQLIPLLVSSNKYARYGAAEALCKAGFGNKAAADRLIELMATDEDGSFQCYAIDALINRDEARGLLSVAKPAIPVLLKMAVEARPDDPRNVLQQSISLALFYNGNAQPRKGLLVKYGLENVDRAMLLSAMKSILTNQNGGTRSLMGWAYAKLTSDEIAQLWPDIYKASRYVAPSGEMFAAGIRTAGLNVMADYHVAEGLDLVLWHIGNNRGHSSVRVSEALEAIERYGAHAKRIVPELEKLHAEWLEKDGKRVKADSASTLIRKTIDKIKALPDTVDFELISIADQIKDIKDPYRP